MAIKRSNWTLWTSSSTPTKNYTVIWWYMEPDGTIVEEKIYANDQAEFDDTLKQALELYNTDPTFKQAVDGTRASIGSSNRTTTTLKNSGWRANGKGGNYNPILGGNSWAATITPLSTSEVLNARYQAAANAGNTNLANAYKALNKENTSYNKVANQIADYYGALADSVSRREQGLADAKYAVANKLFDDMASQKDYVWWLYWPEGTLTTAINKYYDDMWDYLASEAGREMAYADAMWVQSWASLWMMRAQRNQAYNEAFQKSLQIMATELEAKQSIAQNLITFMSNLRKEYWDTANDYIISQYERANDLLNAIEENIAKTSAQLQAYRFSWGGGWSSSSTSWKKWDDMNALERLAYLQTSEWKAFMKANGINSIDIDTAWTWWVVGVNGSWQFIDLINDDLLKKSNVNSSYVPGLLSWHYSITTWARAWTWS